MAQIGIDYQYEGEMKLPYGGVLKCYKDLMYGSSFCVDEQDGQTIEQKLRECRERYANAAQEKTDENHG